jgi:hypothetical protein
VIVPLDVLVEIGAAAAKNRVVVGRQRKIHSRGFSLRHGRRNLEREKREQRWKKRSHQKKSAFPLADQSPVFFHQLDVGFS